MFIRGHLVLSATGAQNNAWPMFSMFKLRSHILYDYILYPIWRLRSVFKEKSYTVKIIIDTSMCVILHNFVNVYQLAKAA